MATASECLDKKESKNEVNGNASTAEGAAAEAGARLAAEAMQAVKEAHAQGKPAVPDSVVPDAVAPDSSSPHNVEKVEKPVADDPEKVEQRKAEIEKKYGVVFETLDSVPANEKERLRQPNLAELDVLDKALAQSEGSTQRTLSNPAKLRIGFYNPGKDDPAAFHQDIRGGSRIIVFGDGTNFALTNEDTKSGKTSLGSVLLHELGHRSDKIAGADYERIGWKKTQDGQFALEAKDGSLYQYVQPNKDKGETWTPYWRKVDESGAAVDCDPVEARVSDTDMQKMMKVPQPMDPSNRPAEAFANAARMYRQSDATRKELQAKSPEIYAYMEEFDRKELAQKGGKDLFGNPYLVRKDGTVQKNDSAWQYLPEIRLVGV